MNETSFTISDLTDMLQAAEQAALEAGNYLIQKLGQAKVEHQKSLRDDLLDVDVEAENIMLTKLRKTSSEIGTLSEENGQEGNHDQYWIVDPLDGSANFQHGSPLFAIAIALIIHKVTTLGVIYLPTSNEMFTAIRNQGACLNGNRIEVSKIATLEEAIIHVGDIMKEGDSVMTRERLEDISKLAMQARRIRMIGTAATDLAFLASGRADALINHAKTPWDIEAGKLILLEAGGRAISKQRENDEILSIYSNGVIHERIESLLFP
jgi:myo-inositol-1(or 4)-monophosphatase